MQFYDNSGVLFELVTLETMLKGDQNKMHCFKGHISDIKILSGVLVVLLHSLDHNFEIYCHGGNQYFQGFCLNFA